MTLRPALLSLAFGAALAFSPRLHADDSDVPRLSAEQSAWLEQRGYFTPGFQSAVHNLVEARAAVAEKKASQRKLEDHLPDLRQESAAHAAQLAALQKELARYEHPEDDDFDSLQREMKDPGVSPDERLALAQAFVWTYPTDPRQAEAVQDLQLIQRQMQNQTQATRQAEAARVAARADLVRRARARQLSFEEWKTFLQDMSQEELVSYLGQPQLQRADYWVYSGAWTSDPTTQARVGLTINFNGTRVSSVAEFLNSR